jgi:hypothetical protein
MVPATTTNQNYLGLYYISGAFFILAAVCVGCFRKKYTYDDVIIASALFYFSPKMMKRAKN